MDALRYELAIEDRIDSMIDRALRRLGQIKAMKEVMALKGNVPKLARTARQIAAPSTIVASSLIAITTSISTNWISLSA
jgi:hypothetical protein